MSIFQSLFLGILQGITEFLPVSSSGHLVVAQKLFGLDGLPLIFDVCLHVATLAAVVLFFRKTIIDLISVFIRMVVKKPLDGDKPKQTTILAFYHKSWRVWDITGFTFTSDSLYQLNISFVSFRCC